MFLATLYGGAYFTTSHPNHIKSAYIVIITISTD